MEEKAHESHTMDLPPDSLTPQVSMIFLLRVQLFLLGLI